MMKTLKKGFVEAVSKGTNSLTDAAKAVSRELITIWRWRQADKTFDEAVREAQHTADSVRIGLVEDSLYERLVTGKASPAECIFFLCNRAPARWRHVQRLEHNGQSGGPLRVTIVTQDDDSDD